MKILGDQFLLVFCDSLLQLGAELFENFAVREHEAVLELGSPTVQFRGEDHSNEGIGSTGQVLKNARVFLCVEKVFHKVPDVLYTQKGRVLQRDRHFGRQKAIDEILDPVHLPLQE